MKDEPPRLPTTHAIFPGLISQDTEDVGAKRRLASRLLHIWHASHDTIETDTIDVTCIVHVS